MISTNIKVPLFFGYSEKDEEEFREVYEKNGKMEIEFQYVHDLGLSKKGKSIFLDQYLET